MINVSASGSTRVIRYSVIAMNKVDSLCFYCKINYGYPPLPDLLTADGNRHLIPACVIKAFGWLYQISQLS